MDRGLRVESRRSLSAPWVTLLIALWAGGCTQYGGERPPPQAYYRTGSPLRDVSHDLERILESVVQIRVVAKYVTYIFSSEEAPTVGQLRRSRALEGAESVRTLDRSRTATAVLVSRSNRRLLLLTAGHAVHVPDSVAEFFGDERGEFADAPASRRVRSVGILGSRENFVVGLPGLEPFRVLVHDAERDLAFLGVQYPRDADLTDPKVLSVEPGDSRRLSWGSHVYMLGYPAGYRMVTQGIVSDPEADLTASFVVGGLGHEGMSGSPIFAVRGDDESLEWVGVARAAAVTTQEELVPEKDLEVRDPWIPYKGPIYLRPVSRPHLGITLSRSIRQIRAFADESRDRLRELGYAPPDL